MRFRVALLLAYHWVRPAYPSGGRTQQAPATRVRKLENRKGVTGGPPFLSYGSLSPSPQPENPRIYLVNSFAE
jgi:hypothetical protein